MIYNVIVYIMIIVIITSVVRDVQKYGKSAPLLGGLKDTIRHILNFIRNIAFFGFAIAIMMLSCSPKRTFLAAAFDTEAIAIYRDKLQLAFSSAPLMFVLEAVSVSAPLALSVFSALAVFFILYLECVLNNIAEESEFHDNRFKKSYYKRILSYKGCFLMYERLID